MGVAAILKGSVCREGKRERVMCSSSTRRTTNISGLRFTIRELTDVFAIQTDLGQEITSALKARLSPDEQQRIERKQTQNAEAYLLYLQAHEIFTRPDRRHDDLAWAEALYKKALQLDSKFALAHTLLSQLESWSYYAVQAVATRMQKARTTAAEALRIEPNLTQASGPGPHILLHRSRL